MATKLVILAAGKGTRNTTYPGLHKALLPIKDRPAISHIISNVPADMEIIVALGYLKDQVRSYLEYVYPERDIKFVEVPDYDGPSSGPGMSLLQCKYLLNEPFIFTSVDTLLSEDIVHQTPIFDWIGVSHEKPIEYACAYQSEHSSKPVIMRQKIHPIFIGIAGIYDHVNYWKRLSNSIGSNEVTAGFDSPKLVPMLWTDVGSDASYKLVKRTIASLPKEDRITYIDNNKVIKYFSDPKICSNLNERIAELELINPNMVAYPYIKGHMFSDELNENFIDMLLTKIFSSWIPNASDISEDCELMYRQKTLDRLASLLSQNSELDKITTINDTKVLPILDYIEMIDWDSLSTNNLPCKFHGDLQPENIIVTNHNLAFIDWRDSFGTNTSIGDMYYDFAKLYHACIVNNTIVAKGNYSVNISNDSATLEIELNPFLLKTLTKLQYFVQVGGFDWKKVTMLGILQYITIASLYENDPKYQAFLFLLGKYFLQQFIVNNNEPTTIIKSIQK